MRAECGSPRLLVRAIAAFTAVCLVTNPLVASAATWSPGKVGCHGATASPAKPEARKAKCHGSGAAVKARKIGCHDTAANSGAGKACCCRKFAAISATHCGCRHDAPPVMTRDSAVPPPLAMLRTVEAYVPLDPWEPCTPRGIPLAPPDPPPRHPHARTFTI